MYCPGIRNLEARPHQLALRHMAPCRVKLEAWELWLPDTQTVLAGVGGATACSAAAAHGARGPGAC